MGAAQGHPSGHRHGSRARETRGRARCPARPLHGCPDHRRVDRSRRAQGGPRRLMGDDGLVLVTGGLGFIGGYVTKALLDKGRRVAVLTRGQTTSPEMLFVLREHEGGFPIEIGSVEDLAQLDSIFARLKPETVVHSASNVDVTVLYRDPYRAFQTNVTGTINVFEAARRTGVRRVVDISSIGVLPPNQYQPIDAAHPIVLARHGPGSGAYG